MRPGLAMATRSFSSRMLSTPLLLAASSSKRSNEVPPSTARHDPHSPHGSPSSPRCSQFRAFARIRAVDVFPVPRGPLSRYACATRSPVTAPFSAATRWAWPTTASNRWGRNRR